VTPTTASGIGFAEHFLSEYHVSCLGWTVYRPLPLQVAAMHGTKDMCHQIWWPDRNSEVSAHVLFCSPSLWTVLCGDHWRETTELLVLETGDLSSFTMSLLRSMHPSWKDRTNTFCLFASAHLLPVPRPRQGNGNKITIV
jgi:hypothetical protein